MTPYTDLTIQKIDTYNVVGLRVDAWLASIGTQVGANGLNQLPNSSPKALCGGSSAILNMRRETA